MIEQQDLTMQDPNPERLRNFGDDISGPSQQDYKIEMGDDKKTIRCIVGHPALDSSFYSNPFIVPQKVGLVWLSLSYVALSLYS